MRIHLPLNWKASAAAGGTALAFLIAFAAAPAADASFFNRADSPVYGGLGIDPNVAGNNPVSPFSPSYPQYQSQTQTGGGTRMTSRGTLFVPANNVFGADKATILRLIDSGEIYDYLNSLPLEQQQALFNLGITNSDGSINRSRVSQVFDSGTVGGAQQPGGNFPQQGVNPQQQGLMDPGFGGAYQQQQQQFSGGSNQMYDPYGQYPGAGQQYMNQQYQNQPAQYQYPQQFAGQGMPQYYPQQPMGQLPGGSFNEMMPAQYGINPAPYGAYPVMNPYYGAPGGQMSIQDVTMPLAQVSPMYLVSGQHPGARGKGNGWGRGNWKCDSWPEME